MKQRKKTEEPKSAALSEPAEPEKGKVKEEPQPEPVAADPVAKKPAAKSKRKGPPVAALRVSLRFNCFLSFHVDDWVNNNLLDRSFWPQSSKLKKNNESSKKKSVLRKKNGFEN
jgi:hypothetical protein